MGTYQRVKFDKEKLLFVVNNYCGGCRQTLDRAIGKADGYISKTISNKKYGSRDTISKTDYLLIKSLYGVDIMLKEPELVKQEDKEVIDNSMTASEMYKVIYSATYDALMMAFKNVKFIKEEE